MVIKMKSEILEEVKSPFTDELIQELIKKYISCGCDDSLFYSEINKLEDTDGTKDNHFTNELMRQIYAIEADTNSKQLGSQFHYESNNSWVIISSEKDSIIDSQISSDNKRPLIYRVYLNLKGEDKKDFVLDYINKCQENNLPYKFKFSRDDSRNDQIVILTSLETFEECVDIIEELTENAQLGELPTLIGKYKNGIGIAEEYYNRLYSPTMAKLALVRSSVKKYLCDHKDEFYNQLSDEDKKKIDDILVPFEYRYGRELKRSEKEGKEYKDRRKKYYQRKSCIDCAREHIENDSDAYVCGKGLLDLGNVVEQIYLKNQEQFINEVTQNYRIIGTQVWGFSQDFVFSNETEEKIFRTEKSERKLSANQIGLELETTLRKGMINKTEGDLIAMTEKKEQREVEQYN